jgi:hypothetical protein
MDASSPAPASCRRHVSCSKDGFVYINMCRNRNVSASQEERQQWTSRSIHIYRESNCVKGALHINNSLRANACPNLMAWVQPVQ